MKIFHSFFFVFFLTWFSVTAQDNIAILHEGQNIDYSSGAGAYSMIAPSSGLFDVTFEVHNSAANVQSWRITRSKINVPNGWTDGLCWGHSTDPFGGSCYSSTQMNSNPWTSPGGAAVQFNLLPNEFGKMKPDFNPADGVSGTAHYRYYITSSSGTSFLDSVDVIIDYVAAIKPVVKDPINVVILPNPAADYINVSLTGIDNMSFKMVDALGNLVLKDHVYGSKKINTSEFRSGVYFITFEGNGTKPFVKKVIIRH
jgi:hypothetical protein